MLRVRGFEPNRLTGAKGWVRITALADAVEAINEASRHAVGSDQPASADHSRQRFEILARAIFRRFKALVTEPTVHLYAERHDNIEAIYKKLSEKRDDADISDLLKVLHRIVNEAFKAAAPGEDQAQGLTVEPVPHRPGKAARRVCQQGQAQGHGDRRHPIAAGAQAGLAAGPEPGPDGL